MPGHKDANTSMTVQFQFNLTSRVVNLHEVSGVGQCSSLQVDNTHNNCHEDQFSSIDPTSVHPVKV